MQVLVLLFSISLNFILTCGCPSDTLTNGCSVPINSTSFPYKVFFHPACQRHDVCYSCGQMHSWSRANCDSGFLNDMIGICRTTNSNLRKRRHIEDYMPLLRHKLKRSIRATEPDDLVYALWGTVCEWAAGAYYQTVRLFGTKHYDDVSPAHICIHQCAIDNGTPNIS
uniref:Phospholipase A2 n=1 Tax=Rhopilema esculentum TaxID=499914 RepID=A0A0H3W5L1_9CNID|nr:phospholipase A2 [Rhopilema esculentum]